MRTIRWALVTALVLAIVGLCSLWLFGTTQRAAPDLAPGYHTTQIDVAHRNAPLPVHLFYPASDPAVTAAAPAALIGQNLLFYGFHAHPDTAPRPGPLPLILLSHGSGGNAVQLGWLATHLAQQGFVVLAPNHPGTTSGDSDPHRTPHVWLRTADMSAALDWITATQPLGLEIDLNRVATIGFSLGGHTALALSGLRVSRQRFIDYCDHFRGELDCGWMQAAGVDFTAIDTDLYEADLSDPRISATVAIDPALVHAVPEGGLEPVDGPVLLINLGHADVSPPQMRTEGWARALPDARHAVVPDAWHFSFLAECSLSGFLVIGMAGEDNICSDLGLRDRASVHAELKPLIASFLLETLAD